jgi:Protein of unknown function (DUF2852)
MCLGPLAGRPLAANLAWSSASACNSTAYIPDKQKGFSLRRQLILGYLPCRRMWGDGSLGPGRDIAGFRGPRSRCSLVTMPDMFVTSMFVTLFAVIVFAIAGAMSWKWHSKTMRLLEKMDGNRPVDLLRKTSAGGDWWAYPRSSGSRAFDEYRAETLRRLEEEQREFRDFLDRLRHAKDNAEFDQFMAERRHRLRL